MDDALALSSSDYDEFLVKEDQQILDLAVNYKKLSLEEQARDSEYSSTSFDDDDDRHVSFMVIISIIVIEMVVIFIITVWVLRGRGVSFYEPNAHSDTLRSKSRSSLHSVVNTVSEAQVRKISKVSIKSITIEPEKIYRVSVSDKEEVSIEKVILSRKSSSESEQVNQMPVERSSTSDSESIDFAPNNPVAAKKSISEISTQTPPEIEPEQVPEKSTRMEVEIDDILDLRDLIITGKSVILKNGWRGTTTLSSLFETGCINEKKFRYLLDNPYDQEAKKDLNRWLIGIRPPIAGLELLDRSRMTFLKALNNNIILPGTVTSLLEAQAATGGIIDPITGLKYSVKEAVKKNLINENMVAILKRSENAVHGYVNRLNPSAQHTHRTKVRQRLNILQAMEKGLVVEPHGKRILEAQVATGGVIDFIRGHRVPLEFALEEKLISGYLYELLSGNIVDSDETTKGFCNPNSLKNQTYNQMLDECVHIPQPTDINLLPYDEIKRGNLDPETVILFREKKFGQGEVITVTLRDALISGHVTQELHEKFKLKTITPQERSDLVDKIKNIPFIGSHPISGVYNTTTRAELTFTDAINKGLIKRAFAIDMVLAQASIGRIVDLKNNKILSYKDVKDKLLKVSSKFGKNLLKECEYASIGYTGLPISNFTGSGIDPRDEKLSVLQAVSVGRISKESAVKILEAQIGTGGIIDHRHKLRVTLKAAVENRLMTDDFAEELENRLSKNYFHLNIDNRSTYADLVDKCVINKNGLPLIQVEEKKEKRSKSDDAIERRKKTSREESIGCGLDIFFLTVP